MRKVTYKETNVQHLHDERTFTNVLDQHEDLRSILSFYNRKLKKKKSACPCTHRKARIKLKSHREFATTVGICTL